MEPINLDSLTPSERTVLRELLKERDQKAVARALGLSPETVKTHLRNAREKCGTGNSFALAKAFALHEGSPPRWGITPERGEDWPHIGDMGEGQAQAASMDDRSDEVREARTPFAFQEDSDVRAAAKQLQEAASGTALRRLSMIAALVLILTLLIILAFPLSESFQRFANLIDPPTR
jgi:DNA-binding CsgD family transcriptional regulator